MDSLVVSTSKTYELLVSLLTKHPQTIEILPGDGSIWTAAQDTDHTEVDPSILPFLFVQGNLGIPKNILYAVYLHAVHIFKSARCSRSAIITHDSPDASFVQDLIASSSILLLANPTHQTALNTRKRLIQSHIIDPDAELHFMASLLASQHCAKHAELWYHRRWILSAACDPNFPDSSLAEVDSCYHLRFASKRPLQEELELVSRACELYPRNYFAWTHRLICVKGILSDYLVGNDDIDFVPFFRGEIATVKRWIDRHVSDYSAIHFILLLSQAAFQSGDSSLTEIVVEEDLPDHAASLVREFPTHEALWMYTWTALSISDSWQTQRTERFMDGFVKSLAQTHRSATGKGDDIFHASQYASQFLSRRVGLKLTW